MEPMNTICIRSGKTRMVAHRGLSGIERENTASAFVAAGNRSYYGIETDVHVTRDGQYVLIHNGSTGGVADVDLPIASSDYAELRDVEIKDRGDSTRRDLRIPLLTDYIQICEKYGKVGVLELKTGFTDEQLAEIAAFYRAADALGHVIFISFSWDNLVRMRKILPDVPLQFLTGAPDDVDALIAQLKEHKIDLDIYYSALDEEVVKKYHDNGILVNCWTVDNRQDAEKLVRWGVDFITSNILE